MKKELFDRSMALYGRCVLGTVLGIFMWISVAIITTVMIPDNEKLTFAGNLAMNIIALIIQCFLFGTIVCSESWRHGDKDGAQDMFKKRSGDPHFGLKVALIATIPSWIAYFLLIADKLFGLWEPYLSVYRLLNGALYPLMVWTLGFNWQRPLIEVPWVGVILSALPIVVVLVLAWISYYLGYKQVPLMKKLMYTNKRGRR